MATLGYRVQGATVMGSRYDEALRAVDRALSLSINLATVTYAAGMIRLYVGDGEGAIAHFERTLHLNPLDPSMSAFIAGLAAAHLLCERYDDALTAAERAIRENPNFAAAHRAKTLVLANLGRFDEAKIAGARLLEVAPEFTVSRYMSVIPLRDPGLQEKAARLLRAAGIPN